MPIFNKKHSVKLIVETLKLWPLHKKETGIFLVENWHEQCPRISSEMGQVHSLPLPQLRSRLVYEVKQDNDMKKSDNKAPLYGIQGKLQDIRKIF